VSYPHPHLIDFNKLGEPAIGYISVAQTGQLPFEVVRTFWTYYTPESIIRGRHAHHITQMILIAAAGRIVVTTETAQGQIATFVLDSPNKGLYLPPNVWHTMQYSHTAVQLVLASSVYEESDYIRNYDEFKKIWGQSS
jgi:hypothetical protein